MGMFSLSPFFSQFHATANRVESLFFALSSSSEASDRHCSNHTSEVDSASHRRICRRRRSGKRSVWRWCSQWCNFPKLPFSFVSSFRLWPTTRRRGGTNARKAPRYLRRNERQEAEGVSRFHPFPFSSLEDSRKKKETFYGSSTAWDEPLPVYPSFASRRRASSCLTSLSSSTTELFTSIPFSPSTTEPFSSSDSTRHSLPQLSKDEGLSTRSTGSEQKIEDPLTKSQQNEEMVCRQYQNCDAILVSPNALLDTAIEAKSDRWCADAVSANPGDTVCSHKERPKESLRGTSSCRDCTSTSAYDALHRLHETYHHVICAFHNRKSEDEEPSQNGSYRGNFHHKGRKVELEKAVCSNVIPFPPTLPTLEQNDERDSETGRKHQRRWDVGSAEWRLSEKCDVNTALHCIHDTTTGGHALAGSAHCRGPQKHCFASSGNDDVGMVEDANACTALLFRLQDELQRQEQARVDAFRTTAVASASREGIWPYTETTSLSLSSQDGRAPSSHSSSALSSLPVDRQEETIVVAQQSERGRNAPHRPLPDGHRTSTLWYHPSEGYPRGRQRQVRRCYRDVLNTLCKEKVVALVKHQYQRIYDTQTRFLSEVLQSQVLQRMAEQYPILPTTVDGKVDGRNEACVTCAGVLRHIREGIPAPIGFLTMDASDEEWRRKCQHAARTSPGTQPTELFLGGLCVSYGQLSSLITPGDWLNDQVINAYLDLLSRRSRSTRKANGNRREEKELAGESMNDDERSENRPKNDRKRRTTEGTGNTKKWEHKEIGDAETEVMEKDREVASLGTHFYAKVLTELEKESHTFSDSYTSTGVLHADLVRSSWSSGAKMSLPYRQGSDSTTDDENRRVEPSFSFSTPLSLPPLSKNSGILRWFRRRRYLLLPYRSPSTVAAATLSEEEEAKEEEVYSAIRCVLIPVNLSNVHWVLVVWDKERKEFVLYDSMGSDHEHHLEKHYKVVLVLRHVLHACFHHFFESSSTRPMMETNRSEDTQSHHRTDPRHAMPFTDSHFHFTGGENALADPRETFFHAEQEMLLSLHGHGTTHRGLYDTVQRTPGPSSNASSRSLWDISSHTLFIAAPLRASGFFASRTPPCAGRVPRRVDTNSGSHAYFSSPSSSLGERTGVNGEEEGNGTQICSGVKKEMTDGSKRKERENDCVSLLHMPSHRCAPQQRNGSDCGVFVCLAAWCLAQGVAVTFPTSASAISFFRMVMGLELWCNKLLIRMVSGFGEKGSADTVSGGWAGSGNRNGVKKRKERSEKGDEDDCYTVFHECTQKMSSSSSQLACSPHILKM